MYKERRIGTAGWCRRQESNLRPSRYECVMTPSNYRTSPAFIGIYRPVESAETGPYSHFCCHPAVTDAKP